MGSHEGSEPQLDDVTAAVRSLVEMMRGNGLTKIDVSVGDVSIKLRAGGVREVIVAAGEPRDLGGSVADPAAEPSRGGHVITAPMIGTYYGSPGPGEPAFVRPGDRIEAGQTIGIIEAMKIMNEISADRGGVVAEILVANAQPVEYGSPLVRLTLDESGV